MSAYLLNRDDDVLLLGEGNFSFSLSLCKFLLERKEHFNFSRFYSTCFEKDVISADALENIEALKRIGCRIHLDVDATSLCEASEINTRKYDKIIFNFPHTGGKMKIHQNRNLLKDFFVSSRSVLKENGVILVALCAGQGGTQDDVVHRKWEDSWQVVEMAAHGDYILQKTERFPNERFPQYVSVGFRGALKSFNTQNAVIYTFVQACPPSISSIDKLLIDNYLTFHKLPDCESIEVPYIYVYMLNSLKEECPQNFLIEKFSQSYKGELSDLPFVCNNSVVDNHCTCLLNGQRRSLRKSLVEVLPSELTQSAYKGIVFNPLTSDFTVPPLKHELTLTGPESKTVCETFLKEMSNIFLSEMPVWHHLCGTDSSILSYHDSFGNKKEMVVYKNDCAAPVELCTIDIDSLCIFLFKLETWKQLWSDRSILLSSLPKPLLLTSLHPRHFMFDINFIQGPEFSIEKLIFLLWQIGGSMIESVTLLNTYTHPNGANLSCCYRIVYKSYEKPLYRKRVVNFHEQIIGKSLEMACDVVVS